MHKLFIINFFLLHFSVFAQNKQIENVVFEGAGIRGIAYAGAIEELEKQNILQNVKKVGGTSAGAITALMIALGYNAQEITGIISKTNFAKFNDGSYFFAGGLSRIKNYFGWYRGKRFEQCLGDLIYAKTGDADMTFLQLKNSGFKDIYVTGTSLNRQQLIVFSHEYFPNMKVKDAVRISMSIPLYFEAVFIDSAGRVVKHPKNKNDLDVMVDGGFIANFPIHLFDSTKYIYPELPNKFFVNDRTIGFRIDRNEQIQNDSSAKGLAAMPVTNFKEYINAFYVLVLENLNRQTLSKQDWQRTVSISDANISPRIRKLSKEEVSTLINNGRNATVNYLK
ncbi:MAG: patatin-like phospholipase family protein [Chitinophagaceae bacterium]